jgi:hypothetical protein
VRTADQQTVIVADGFSCKTQIGDAGTGRRALHLAELMQLAREHGRGALLTTAGPPERLLDDRRPAPGPLRRTVRTAAPLTGAAVSAALLARRGATGGSAGGRRGR